MSYDPQRISAHEKRAEELFLSGYNCAQSVFAAFSDVTGMELEASLKLAAPFGAGMCGQRDTCGAATGMLMVLGALRGGYAPSDNVAKSALYSDGRELTDEFSSLLGSRVCRELLASLKLSATPSVRTEEYYKARPCARFCAVAAHLLDAYVESHE